jgi:iron uptake system EfeUOB component EfeO/EfeM
MAKRKPSSKPDLPAPKRKLSVAILLEQIAAKKGNLAAIARAFQVTRQSVSEFVQKHDILKKAVIDAREVRLDDAEDKLGEAIESGEAWAICFFLKTQGKGRGYVERQEISQAEPVRLNIVRKVIGAHRDAGGGVPPEAG